MMIFMGSAIDDLLNFAWGTILPQLVRNRRHTAEHVTALAVATAGYPTVLARHELGYRWAYPAANVIGAM
jgi:hypothetical protein